MSKKGQLLLKLLFELLIGVFVVAGLFYLASEYATQEAYFKSFLVKETALLADGMYAVPGNVFIEYPANVSKYDITLRSGRVELSSQIKSYSHLFPWAGTVNTSAALYTEHIILSKNGDTLSLGESGLRKLRCGTSSVALKGKKLKMRVTKETEDIAKGLSLHCSSDFLCASDESGLTREEDIFIKIVPSEKKELVARVFYNSSLQKENGWIACTFLNSFVALSDAGTILLPTSDNELGKKNDKISLLIEMGSAPHYIVIKSLREVFS